MTARAPYAPGLASGAQVRKDGEKWTLILVRELRHSPEKVWQGGASCVLKILQIAHGS